MRAAWVPFAFLPNAILMMVENHKPIFGWENSFYSLQMAVSEDYASLSEFFWFIIGNMSDKWANKENRFGENTIFQEIFNLLIWMTYFNANCL